MGAVTEIRDIATFPRNIDHTICETLILRDPHPLAPKTYTVIITEALRREITKGPEIGVTVVPVVQSANEKCDLQNVLKFDRFELLTYK